HGAASHFQFVRTSELDVRRRVHVADRSSHVLFQRANGVVCLLASRENCCRRFSSLTGSNRAKKQNGNHRRHIGLTEGNFLRWAVSGPIRELPENDYHL